MSDMLVKLYEVQDNWNVLAEQAAAGVLIRKPIGPEKHRVIEWVREHFADTWASEIDMALSNRPITCFIALKNETPIGFACYDATVLGFFGPSGVAEAHRGKGTGKALLLTCLLDMKWKGYAYAIIGAVGPAEFYRKTVGAVEIPDSTPGVYQNMLRRST